MAIVAQARHPDFYERFHVPDTVDGRFDMIVLHVYLTLARLRETDSACTELQMMLQETMFADLDRSLREMGVGDMSVGKHVKAMASAYFGRLSAYDAAFESGKVGDVEDALSRNVWRGDLIPGEGVAHALAVLVLEQKAHLAGQDGEDLCSGVITFLLPERSLPSDLVTKPEQEHP